jgi:hypothetical protein
MDADRRLATYLSDHLAGSSAAIRLVQRHADREPPSPSATVMRKLLEEIREDREELERVMTAVGANANPIKQAGAIGAEMLTSLRNKVPVVGAGSQEIARLEELEILSLGIEGKRLLWLALETRSDAALKAFDFPTLAKRAKAQRDRLEPLRREAAVEAFGT